MDFEELRKALTVVQPDYRMLAEFGREALPHLRTMIERDEPHLSPKATYLAGILQGLEEVDLASRARVTSVRVAAAAATQYLPPDQASPILERLVTDEYYGARKMALRFTPASASEELIERVREIYRSTDDAILRRLAAEAINRNTL